MLWIGFIVTVAACRSVRSTFSNSLSAASNFGTAYGIIKEVQKSFRAREAEKREMEVLNV